MITNAPCKVMPVNNYNAPFGIVMGNVYEAVREMSAHTVPMNEWEEVTYIDVTYRINGVQYMGDDFEEV